MRALRSVWLIPSLLVLVIALTTLACTSEEDDTDDPGSDQTPTATVTPEVTPDDGNGDGLPDTTAYSEDDSEYQLAVLDAGGFVPLDDPVIDTYANLLDSIDPKCEEDRTLIGDQALTATQLLADEGISVTILEALQGMDGSIPEGSVTLSCAEIAAAWVVLVSSQ